MTTAEPLGIHNLAVNTVIQRNARRTHGSIHYAEGLWDVLTDDNPHAIKIKCRQTEVVRYIGTSDFMCWEVITGKAK